ncbi:MBL fold metallo-hydrolase [bacterium]|nr:MBL fold metallo-hydrolase [bacterium]
MKLDENHTIKIRVLGSGTSMGVPVIGCKCPVCTSNDPHNKRLRSSISIAVDSRHILIDCSIDFREQMLRWPMPRIDALLLTHTHADHVNGIDDIRSYNYMQQGPIPVFTSAHSIEDIRRRFPHCFNPMQKGGGVPQLDLNEITAGKPFDAAGIEVMPLRVMHGRLPILGFRIGRFAYMTDCSGIPEQTEELLEGVDTLIISALRHRPHETHFCLAQSLEASQKLGVRRAFFTHIADELDHEKTNRDLPDWARLLYDGQVIEIQN